MQLEMEGTLDHLIDELKNTYNQPLPEADLLLSNSYDELMLDVVDVKDLPPGILRMYGPLEPWRPSELELVK